MGNINNPCINRWGVNTFWNHYWYTDMKYNVFLQQDVMFTTLLKIYLHYGAETPAVFWQDPFWYKLKNYSAYDELHYDCRWFVKHEVDLGYSISYVIRNEGPETFETRWTIMRFNNWIVINVSWFQPDKLKNKRRRRSNVVHQFIVDSKLKPSVFKKTRLFARLTNNIQHTLTAKLTPNTRYLF